MGIEYLNYLGRSKWMIFLKSCYYVLKNDMPYPVWYVW